MLPLEAKARKLFPRLPVPIQEKVEAFHRQIPEKPAEVDEARLTLSIRYQNVVGMLNEINSWNLKVHEKSEMRDLGGGVEAEVTTLYLGIGQGLYASSAGKAAGVGTSTPDGWKWIPVNDKAADIARAIAIFKNDEDAAFVPVPIRIR